VPEGETATPPARPRPLRGDAPPAARPRPAAAAPAAPGPRSSRLGGAILIAVLVLIVGGLIAFVATRGDDGDDQAATPSAEATATATPSATAAATGNDIILQGTGSSGAAGLMRLVRGNDGKVRFAIAAEKVPANRGREVYAVWFTKSGSAPRRLGFAKTQVGKDGVLTTAGPQKQDEDAFPSWFATYEKVLITRETSKSSKPGPAVLEGTLPGAAG